MKISLSVETYKGVDGSSLSKARCNQIIKVYEMLEQFGNENITYVGTISGSDKPVIIQVLNSINTEGLSLSMQDKSETVIAATFTGHYDDDDDNPPFKIYYPKAKSSQTL